MLSRADILSLRAKIESLRLNHYECEDSWYSCPLSEGGCCDDTRTGCHCSAEAHNRTLDEILALFFPGDW